MAVINLLRNRTDPERVEAYTRWSIYGSFMMLPAVGLVIIAAVDGFTAGQFPWAAAYMVGLVIQAAAGIVLSAQAMRQSRDGVTVSRVWVLANVAACFLAAGTALGLSPGAGLAGRGGGVALAIGVCLMALATIVPVRYVLPLAALGGALVAVVAWISLPEVPDPEFRQLQPLPALISTGVVFVAITSSLRFSVWLLAVVWELDRTRAVHARLAVAEERLRFSRDLHDVVGRAFSAIAVKSELAGALADRGQEGAAVQMAEVRDLAQDTLKEVRGVVAGYRVADLRAEIEGARSVLRSAGTEVEITGAEQAGDLPRPVQEALAWVVREAVTNVVRHSAASRCDIVLRTDQPGAVRLSVSNDGVGQSPRGHGGSGLAGLRERLAPLGGDLETALLSDVYTLTALVPFTAPRAGQDESEATTTLERDSS